MAFTNKMFNDFMESFMAPSRNAMFTTTKVCYGLDGDDNTITVKNDDGTVTFSVKVPADVESSDISVAVKGCSVSVDIADGDSSETFVTSFTHKIDRTVTKSSLCRDDDGTRVEVRIGFLKNESGTTPLDIDFQ